MNDFAVFIGSDGTIQHGGLVCETNGQMSVINPAYNLYSVQLTGKCDNGTDATVSPERLVLGLVGNDAEVDAPHAIPRHGLSSGRRRRRTSSRARGAVRLISYNVSPTHGRQAWRAWSVRGARQVRAKVAELVDALDLGSSGETRESSSLSFRTRFLAF